jgi:hypothetical protein
VRVAEEPTPRGGVKRPVVQISVVVAKRSSERTDSVTRTLKAEAEKGSPTTAIVRGLIDPKPAARGRRGRTGGPARRGSRLNLDPAKGNGDENSPIRQADQHAATRSNSETVFLASGRVLSSC